MEKVTGAENTIEVFENDIELYIKLYCEKGNIESLKSESQNVWNGCLIFIYRHIFKNTGRLLQEGALHGEYNYILLNDLCDYYISLCTEYDKEISINGYCFLTGISPQTLYTWEADKNNNIYNNNIYNNKTNRNAISEEYIKIASVARKEIYKKLIFYREESLTSKLVTGKQNPVGVIAILNKHYGYNMPGVRDSRPQISENRTPEAITEGYQEQPKLPQN